MRQPIQPVLYVGPRQTGKTQQLLLTAFHDMRRQQEVHFYMHNSSMEQAIIDTFYNIYGQRPDIHFMTHVIGDTTVDSHGNFPGGTPATFPDDGIHRSHFFFNLAPTDSFYVNIVNGSVTRFEETHLEVSLENVYVKCINGPF